MKILFLSFYYEPDLCACSFRSVSLINQFKKIDDVEIDLITTMPNRYSSYNKDAREFETQQNINIKRVDIPLHSNDMFGQIKSFISYYFQVMQYTRHKKYDVIFCTSSRLFTAFLGARISRKKGVPLYLDIRDIFVDTISDILPSIFAFFISRFLKSIENYTFNSACHINLVSPGFKNYFQDDFQNLNYSYFTNGIDSQFLNSDIGKSPKSVEGTVRVLYAGNIGDSQGLHNIIPKLSVFLGERFVFEVIGDGGMKRKLLESCDGISNVKLLPPVSRDELLNLYKSADVLFLHLNNHEAFKKVIPSKIFEYAATGKPILAGVDGFPSTFINDEIINAQVFLPNDVHGAVVALKNLNLCFTNREEFIKKYRRDHIMQKMVKSILGVVLR